MKNEWSVVIKKQAKGWGGKKKPNSTVPSLVSRQMRESGVPSRNDLPPVISTTKTLLNGAPGQSQTPKHKHNIHTNVPQQHQEQAVPWEPNTPSLFLPLPSTAASAGLPGESVYPQSAGIVQLMRKCTKCLLLSCTEPFPSTVGWGSCTERPFAHHSRCQRGFGLHA